MKMKKLRFVAESNEEKETTGVINGFLFAGYALVAATIIFGSFFTVPEGQKALITTFGRASNTIYGAGMHIKAPLIQSVKRFDVKTIRADYKTQTYTKDIQTAELRVSYTYNLIANDIVETYRVYDNDWQERILYPNLEQALKSEVGTWNADTMVANRDKVAENVLRSLQERMISHKYPVAVTNFQLINIDYSNQFEQSIEKKVIAEQAALEEANRTKQIEQKAHQKVVDAKAEAESMRIRAKALEQNPKLVSYEAVQKWDGRLPQIIAGDGSTPILDLRSITK